MSGKQFSLAELSTFNGKDDKCPIYIAIKYTVYDVSSSRHMYGAGKSYNVFAGKEATRGLAKMSLKLEELEPIGVWDDLPQDEAKTLQEWIDKFVAKYPIVGTVQHSKL